MLNQEHPVIVGLCGQACTGKTSVADRLAPPAMAIQGNDQGGFVWDHLFLAMPLYEMASILRKTQGQFRKDRVLFQLDSLLKDLLGRSPLYGLPPYDEFISIVKHVADTPINHDESMKPRSFLQHTGKYCRGIDPDCFIKSVTRKSSQNFSKWKNNEATEDMTYICIVSDVRMMNEAEWIANHPNGILIEYTATEDTRKERMLKRDGQIMTPEQLAHESEKTELIGDELVDYTIPTDTLSIEEQTTMTKKLIFEKLGLEVYA